MRLLLDNLPPSLQSQRATLARCLEAMDRALPLQRVILFGSHARGDARPDSDVDLCLVTDGAEQQFKAAERFSEAIWDVWPRPAFTLIPITPYRLAEKEACHDYFFGTVLNEGVLLATQN
jgi:predicted nucleotidyltransferase